MSIPRDESDGNQRSWFDDFHAVRDLPIDSQPVKHLLLVLMTFVRQDSCFPSMATITACLGVSKVETTREWIRTAVGMKLLRVETRTRDNGTQASNRYIIDFDEIYRLNQGFTTPPCGGGVPPRAAGGGPSRAEGGLELSSRTVQFCISSESENDTPLATAPMPTTDPEPPGWWMAAKGSLDQWSAVSRKHPMVASRGETERIQHRLLVSLANETVVFAGQAIPALLMIPKAVSVLMANGVQWKNTPYVCGCIVGTIKEWQTHGIDSGKPVRKSAVDERRAARAAKEFPEQIELPIL